MKSFWRSFKMTAVLAATALLCCCGGGGGGSEAGGTTTQPTTPPPTQPTQPPTQPTQPPTEPTPRSTSLSGTAAAGGPITGTVTIKDSTKPAARTVTVPIAADGSYSAQLTGMTPPYLARADGSVAGRQYHLYSAATAADADGHINITPLTDLIVANVAGTLPGAYFDGGNFSGMTAQQLKTQSDALRAKLLPILEAVEVTGTIDLLRASFNPNHTGLDAALDLIRVSIDPASATATISNTVTSETITSNLASRSYSGAITGVTATALAELPKIRASFRSLSGLFATALPGADDPRLRAFFDQATFLESGEDLAGYLARLTAEPKMVGAVFDNVYLESMSADGATVAFEVLLDGRPINDRQKPWRLIRKTDGTWYLQGDQRIAMVRVQPLAEYQSGNTPATIITGLNLEVRDLGNRGITSALFTGKGLPGPVRLTNANHPNWLTIEDPRFGDNDFYFMTDPQITAMADSGELYSIELFQGSTRVASYSDRVKKRPYLNGELSAADFPAFTAPTLAQFRAFNGGDITFSWTLPAGLSNQRLVAGINDGSGHSALAEASLLPAEQSKTLHLNGVTSGTTPAPFTPTGRWGWLETRDGYGRHLGTSIW